MTLTTDQLRQLVRAHLHADETETVTQLVQQSQLEQSDRSHISDNAALLVQRIRDNSEPALMENFLAEFGLSSEEGVALMCLAEALLRVPDDATVDALIHDKIVPADWGKHLGQSSSSLVNASTWALLLTGKIIADEQDGIAGMVSAMVRRLGEPVIRTAVNQAIRELGNQFVLGTDIDHALDRSKPATKDGYTYSYDMLGEAAKTDQDAKRFHLAYSQAVSLLGRQCNGTSVVENPGISVKLSALHPRYEFLNKSQVMVDLVARTRSLAMLARSANMGFNIDAEEADRLDLSLDVIEQVLSEPSLAGWDGFGIVVQGYSQRAWYVIDWLYDLATRLDRKIMIRLVKGAYWDSEIKLAQVQGLEGFPVFTRKAHTDVSYIACAEKLLGMRDRIYPQFATHNAHTVSSILYLAQRATGQIDPQCFEFQRLHGMGDALHQQVMQQNNTRCRIYAPVGAHEQLLAYLVRRLLENGANSSFVNQIVDESVSPREIAADPFDGATPPKRASYIALPSELFNPQRQNSNGFDIADPIQIETFTNQRNRWRSHQWQFSLPLLDGVPSKAPSGNTDQDSDWRTIVNPADSADHVGYYQQATVAYLHTAFDYAAKGFDSWQNTAASERATFLQQASNAFEAHSIELISLLCREAGKTLVDAIAEIREAVDFLRYYSVHATELSQQNPELAARGTFVCISPWNFPLAIFSGQIAAALACGNCVIAKPAEQTPLIAHRVVELFHQAGIPMAALLLCPGDGASIGAALVSNDRLAGVCFTGSTRTAQSINRAMAEHADPLAPLIAETGGLNAMIIDSTALPEQAVGDIVESAFRSAGQRCSALRMLYVQSDVMEKIQPMLTGAMDLLTMGDPWHLDTDVGPVIDQSAQDKIAGHCQGSNKVHCSENGDFNTSSGHYIAPTLLSVSGIADLQEEIFGPVLHIAQFAAADFYQVLRDINDSGYGLTFGLHTRVDERVQDVVEQVEAGNIYINRNQIGAVVGSQPFGGKKLSGTGPKAGGPHYLLRFLKAPEQYTDSVSDSASHSAVTAQIDLVPLISRLSVADHHRYADRLMAMDNRTVTQLASYSGINANACIAALNYARQHYHETIDLPGPTGESNRLWMQPSGVILCLHTGSEILWQAQILQALALGNSVVAIGEKAEKITQAVNQLLSGSNTVSLVHARGQLDTSQLTKGLGFSAIVVQPATTAGEQAKHRETRLALAASPGVLLPLCADLFDISPLISEKTMCIDTTASGGNASLLAAVE